MTSREDKKLTPSDLDPIMAMHSDLKETLQRGMDGLQNEMKSINLTQVGLAKDIDHIKKSQEKYDEELAEIRRAQLSCPASTGFVGTSKRLSRLERFRDQALSSGIMKASNTATPLSVPALQISQSANNTTPVSEVSKGYPTISDRFIRVSLTLLFGAALGGAILAAFLFSH